MFLKSLSMKGFKSFADPTVLEFEPGITVVVGPNGSGKSNVVDAVTWVLGAQGPRSLRSAKMEDVIFAGTSSRPQLGRAEVSLTIDNSSGKLPIDLAEVTITRTLFRSGDSEYAINGAPCRLLDIQELLSDSGVGRQQHMIIGQGQLDTVLNARPEDRRAIIEEAAGVLKHRRRRERAERRLAGTAENLERLGDLVREVRRQIRPLERQAAAARSHDTVATELLTVRRYLAGAEQTDLSARRSAAAAEPGRVPRRGSRAARRAGARSTPRRPPRRPSSRRAARRTWPTPWAGCRDWWSGPAGSRACCASGAGAWWPRSTRPPTSTWSRPSRPRRPAWPASWSRPRPRRRPAGHPSGPSSRRRWRGSTRRRRHCGSAGPRCSATTRRTRPSPGSGPAPSRWPAPRRASSRTSTRSGCGWGRSSSGGRAPPCGPTSWPQQADELEQATGALAAELAARSAELERAVQAAEAAQVAADEAEEGRHRTAARAEALERALADLQGAGGRELLRDVDGVVGSLVDLVEIDDGLGRRLRGGHRRRRGRGRGRRPALGPGRAGHPARGRGHGGHPDAPVVGASAAAAAHELPPGSSAEPVRGHVRVRHGGAVAESVLDTLVGRAVRVDGWEEAIDLSLARDDLVVVTPEGDRFAATGWRVRSATSVVTAASVEEARRRAEDAAAAAELARAHLAESRIVLGRCRDARTAAERANDRHASACETGPGRQGALGRGAAPRWPASSTRPGPRWPRRSSAWPRSRPSRRSWPGRCPSCRRRWRPGGRWRSGASSCGAGARSSRCAWPAWSNAGASWPSARPRWSGACRATPRSGPPRRTRRRRLEAEGAALARLEVVVQREHERLDGVFESLRHDYQDQVDAVRAGGEKLERLRQDRHTTEQRLEAVRNRTRTLDLESNEVDLRLEALHEHIARDLGATPEELTGLPEPEAPEGTTLAQHAEELERKLAALGPVNPLALEELSTLEERHKELEAQVDDVRGARRELHEVVRTLDHEIMTSFAAAAADVNEHFSTLIAMLFPGGTGRLMLVDPDDLLNTGVEIEVRPAGRNVRRVSLLSGGERSMAALAFLFAVFRSRPSPFYMMDEVEAALDDVNLSRFLALVHEFRDEAQLLIVSHQKRTMETGDALYGVTMAPGGSSQVVSQKVEKEKEPA